MLNPVSDAIAAMKAIALMGGNLPDEVHMEPTGPNDARQRGIMYVNCREIARKFLEKHAPDALTFNENGAPVP